MSFLKETFYILLYNNYVILINFLLKFINKNYIKFNILFHTTKNMIIFKTETKVNADNAAPVQQVRRAAGQRAGRRRMQQQQQQNQNQEPEVARANENNDENQAEDKDIDSKIGAKKRAKLEAKAEKKVQREAQEREREQRKKREQALQEERDKQSQKEREDEKRREEAEKREREEKEQREHEEYLKMKEAFSVEEEGFDKDDGENQNLLQEFVSHIKESKVVILEDLALRFNLKTSSVVERIRDLQTEGILSGVIDDRGKFIYISRKELEAVATFVKQRGRISISELVEHSNRLIDLNPTKGAT